MKFRNYLAPLGQIPELDESSYRDVVDSVHELAQITGQTVSTSGLSVQELLGLQKDLQNSLQENL